MTWMNLFFVGGGGMLLGYLFARFSMRPDKSKQQLQAELEKARFELEQYRQDLVDHFAQSANLLQTLSKDYAKLQEHMAQSSKDLISNSPAQDNPFNDRLVHRDLTEESIDNEAPRDYADKASNLLKNPTSP